MRKLHLLLSAAAVMVATTGCPQSKNGSFGSVRGDTAEVGAAPAPPNNPKELGWVRWHRDYATAAALSRETGKPMFLLFQEVPGCSTCVGFGESVLSHPLMIEAIETDFIPVAIHNNKAGRDRDVLDRFREPAWNNPVVRFVNADGGDLIARADGVWSTHGIATRMERALEAAGRDVPEYLTWASQETAPGGRTTFSMYCYWSGEACLGAIPGVVATRAGHLNGREVVEVDFDGRVLTKEKLRELAEARACGEYVAKASAARDASDSDQKYYLQRSRWRYVPLTPLQASRVNSALRSRIPPERYVSPRQLTLFREIQSADQGLLDALERPEALRELADYEYKLRARLAKR